MAKIKDVDIKFMMINDPNVQTYVITNGKLYIKQYCYISQYATELKDLLTKTLKKAIVLTKENAEMLLKSIEELGIKGFYIKEIKGENG